jgi:DNA repair exonuclease SbcCD ATPase subunit
MSIVIKNITLRNFLSIGAVTQAVNFDNKELTLILGENLDLGGAGSRNGTGKTSLMQALSYALFDLPINKIRKDNLINRTNGKGMMITLEYSSKGVDYKIERGRRPNILKFYVNGVEQQEDKDTAQGENKDTQKEIERTLGMTHDMFKHIVALNTYTEPFLSLGAGEQRKIIEQLLGITLLSEKAEAIKTKMKSNKDTIEQEQFKVKTIQEANKRVEEQIENLRRRQRLWNAKHSEDLNNLVSDFDELSKIDITAELKAHADLAIYNEKKKKQDTCNALIARQTAWMQKRDADVAVLQASYDNIKTIDIAAELQAHSNLKVYNANKIELASLNKTIASLEATLKKDKALVTKLESEIKTLEENKCYACGQDFHDENHTAVVSSKRELLTAAHDELTQTQTELEKNKNSIFDLGLVPVTHYKTEAEAIKHESELENIQNQINTKMAETDPYAEQIDEACTNEVLGPPPATHYDTEAEAIEHRSVVAGLVKQIETKVAEVDPYVDQISDMEANALQEVNFEKINELSKLGDHLKFLLDLLTSKDSFVRKKIIDQNLSYLNARLTHYLDKIGLPHTVVFMNDLSVEITELGRELDFDNLSRGERNRLILGLSFAFRDVWENLYFPINTLFIDELIDSGLDSIGVENSMAILKDMSRRRSKSIWLVSHREELAGRVPSVLKVVKEAGFTTYSTTTEID